MPVSADRSEWQRAIGGAHDGPRQAVAHARRMARLQLAGVDFGHHFCGRAGENAFAVIASSVQHHLIKRSQIKRRRVHAALGERVFGAVAREIPVGFFQLTLVQNIDRCQAMLPVGGQEEEAVFHAQRQENPRLNELLVRLIGNHLDDAA